MKVKKILYNIVTGLLVLCASIVAILIFQREFSQTTQSPSPLYIDNWESLEVLTKRQGSKEAPVQIIEFFDYQCPYCKAVEPSVQYILEKFPEEVSLRYAHYPLNSHSYAYEAALAAECAAIQNRFQSYHQLLFAHQEELNKINYESLAVSAKVENTKDFSKCLENRATFLIIENGMALASELDIDAIPTFLINGKLISGALSKFNFENIVKEELTKGNK
jgi:protein-disulfide isomerase